MLRSTWISPTAILPATLRPRLVEILTAVFCPPDGQSSTTKTTARSGHSSILRIGKRTAALAFLPSSTAIFYGQLESRIPNCVLPYSISLRTASSTSPTTPISSIGNTHFGSRRVDISTNGGSTWTNVHRYQKQDTPGPHHEDIDVSAIAGNQSNVMVRFHYYNAAFSFWWQVDNVQVGVQCAPVPGGLLTGNVYDGQHRNGAERSNRFSVSVTSTRQRRSQHRRSNLHEGFYILFSSLTGKPFIHRRRGNYASDTLAVNVTADHVVLQNFNLAAGKIVPNPASLQDTVALGAQDTVLLTLQNIGGADADFRLYEGYGNTNGPQPEAKGAPLMRIVGHYSPLRNGTTKDRFSNSKDSAATEAAAETQRVAGSRTPPWSAIADYPDCCHESCLRRNRRQSLLRRWCRQSAYGAEHRQCLRPGQQFVDSDCKHGGGTRQACRRRNRWEVLRHRGSRLQCAHREQTRDLRSGHRLLGASGQTCRLRMPALPE